MTAERPKTLAEVLWWRAGTQPDTELSFRRMVGSEAAGTLSYRKLLADASGLAALLQDRVGADQPVVLVYPAGLDFVRAFFACTLAGLIPVPVAGLAPGAPIGPWRGLLARVVQDSGAQLVLGSGEVGEQLNTGEPGEEPWRIPVVATDRLALDPDAAPVGAPGPDDVAFLQYSSGSTGRPKAVVVRHAQLLANLGAIEERVGLHRDDRFVSWLPMYHDMGLVGGVMAPLWVGCPAWYLSPFDFLRRPAEWLEEITRVQGTFSPAPDSAYSLCSRRVDDDTRDGLDLRSWAVALSGAERVRPATIERFTERFAPCGFAAQAFLPCYGLAESTLLVTGAGRGQGPTVVRPAQATDPAARPDAGALVSVGSPASSTTVLVVDPASGTVRPPGGVGEVWVAGPSVAERYWNDPGADADTFGARLAGDGPYLRTGDLGFELDGELVICGRLKDMILVRGRNFFPEDIEESAQRADSRLRAGGGAALAVEDRDRELVVLLQETDVADPELLAALASRIRTTVLADLALRLDAVVLLAPRTLVKTTSGKLRRQAYRDEYLRGALVPRFEWSRWGAAGGMP